LLRLFEYCITHDHIVGAVNATSPNPVTMDQFGKTIGKVWRRSHLFPVPSMVMKLMLGEMSTLVLKGQHVIPQVMLTESFPFHYQSLDEALNQLKKTQK